MRIACSAIVRVPAVAAVALALVAGGAGMARAQNADVFAEIDRTMESIASTPTSPAWCGASCGTAGWCT